LDDLSGVPTQDLDERDVGAVNPAFGRGQLDRILEQAMQGR